MAGRRRKPHHNYVAEPWRIQGYGHETFTTPRYKAAREGEACEDRGQADQLHPGEPDPDSHQHQVSA